MNTARAEVGATRNAVEWERIAVGDELPDTTFGPLTITDFVRYQGASGDMNPIHHDTEFARRAGFPGPFAVGMLSAGLLAGRAVDWLGPTAIRSFKVRFRDIAWPGDTLTLTARVTEKSDSDRTVTVELCALNQDDGVHAQAWAKFELTQVAPIENWSTDHVG